MLFFQLGKPSFKKENLFYIVLTPISITSGLKSTGNTRKYHQIDVYIYQCENNLLQNIFSSSLTMAHSVLFI